MWDSHWGIFPGSSSFGPTGCIAAVLIALLFAGGVLGLLAMLLFSIKPIW